uniref:Uncharacterized protein n=1 Tax=Caenorhabditis japonica TaxID=281687 RepID=A0A8R1DIB1_CAEJA
MACAYCALEKYQDAQKCVEKQLETAIRIDDAKVPKIRENLALIAEICENYALAIQQRKILNAGEEVSSKETLHLLELYLKSGNPEKVLNFLENAEKIGNDATLLIGKAYAMKGDPKKALRTLIPMSRDSKNHTFDLIDTINQCMLQLDDLNSSIEFLNNTIKASSGKNVDLVLHCYCLLCQTQIAASNLESALKIAKYLLRICRFSEPSESQNLEVHEANAFRLLAIIYEHQKDTGSSAILWQKYLDFKVLTLRERVKGFLQLARVTHDEDVGTVLEKALETADRLPRPIERVQCLSAKYRWLLKTVKHLEAKQVLEQMKTHLEDDKLDSKTKSLIYEDLALSDTKNREKSDDFSTEKLLALEQSLTEAQDADEMHREAEILEKLGDLLKMQRKFKLAEKYFCQQLEVARQLKNAKMMADSHANIAKLKWELKDRMDQVCEHARNALTIFKLATDNEKKVEMLILLARAENERKNPEIALSAAEKAISLAEDCESNEQLCSATRLVAEIYQKSTRNEISIQFIRKHINLFEYEKEPRKKFESLRDLMVFEQNRANFEAVEHILRIMTYLELNESNLLEISDLLSQKFSDFSWKILKFIMDSGNFQPNVDFLSRIRQKPAFLIQVLSKSENFRKFEEFHVDLAIFAPKILEKLAEREGFQISNPKIDILMAYHRRDWDTVLNRIRVLNSEISEDKLIKIVELSATWHLGKTINWKELEQFDSETQTRLFDMFCGPEIHSQHFENLRNKSIDIHVRMLQNNRFDMMADGQQPIDKIVCAAHLDEKELIEMWFSEFLAEEEENSTGNLKIYDQFLPLTRPEILRFAAAFTAVSVGEKFKILEILENCELALTKSALKNRNFPKFDKLKWSKVDFSWSFPVSAQLLLIFQFKKGENDVEIIWKQSSETLTFYDLMLRRLLQSFGFSRWKSEKCSVNLLIGEKIDNLEWKEHRFLLGDFEKRTPSEKSISALNFLPNTSPSNSVNALDFLHQTLEICAQKLEVSNIILIDAKSLDFLEFLEIFLPEMKCLPNTVLVVNGPLPSKIDKMLTVSGCDIRYAKSANSAVELAQRLIAENTPRGCMSTVRNDVKLAIESDYCIPDTILTARLDFEQLLAEFGKTRLLELLSMEDTGQINQKIREIPENNLKSFAELVFSDHLFQKQENLRISEIFGKEAPANYG